MTSGSEISAPRIWLVDLDLCGPALDAAEQAMSLLSEGELSHVSSLGDARAAVRWRRSRAALRLLLVADLGQVVGRRDFATTIKGKPFLPGVRRSFNVSHSGSECLIGLASDGDIGVDLELERDISFDAKRAGLIRAAGAALAENAVPGPRGDISFLQAWTRLEAISKARALGLQALLSELGIRGPADRLPREEEVATRAKAFAQGFMVVDLFVGEGRYAAVASAGPPPRERVPNRFPSDLGSVMALAGLGDEGIGG